MAKRDQDVHFLASKEEVERIHQKMDELGIRSMGAYLRKMALDGYCINLDLQDVKALVSLLRICSNNLNQYAKRANETGSIYEADIKDLQERLETLHHDQQRIQHILWLREVPELSFPSVAQLQIYYQFACDQRS